MVDLAKITPENYAEIRAQLAQEEEELIEQARAMGPRNITIYDLSYSSEAEKVEKAKQLRLSMEEYDEIGLRVVISKPGENSDGIPTRRYIISGERQGQVPTHRLREGIYMYSCPIPDVT